MRTIAITTAILAFGPIIFAQQVREVSTAEAVQMVEQGAVFVDVREPDEVASAAYPMTGLVHIPSGSLADHLPKIPESGMVILACQSGYRSGVAFQQLTALGYDNLYSLQGGMAQWQRDGLPVIRVMNASSAAGKPCCASGTAKSGCSTAAEGATAQACCADGSKRGGKGMKGKKGKKQCCAEEATTSGCCEKK